jgi:hypothetical protein
MPYTLGPRQTFEALPTAEYRLTLKSWKEIVEDKDTQYSKRGDIRNEFNWIVTVPGAEDQDRRDWCNVPQTFSEKATFVHIAVALQIVDNDKAIAEGATVDWDQGVGKSCLGTIVKALKADNKTWGDKITAYAPLPAAQEPAKPKADMAAKLRERTSVLSAFAGLPDSPTDGLAVTALTNGLKALGAQPITPAALQTLQETIETANTFGFNEFDDLPLVGLTLKDALVLFEKITARMDA